MEYGNAQKLKTKSGCASRGIFTMNYFNFAVTQYTQKMAI